MIGGLGLVLAFVGGVSGTAVAELPTYAVGNSAVVNVAIGNANVTIKTWDRQEVQTGSTVPLTVVRFGSQAVAKNLPRQMDVLSGTIQTQRGPLTLPAETFPLSSVGTGEHDGLTIKGNGGDATILIPQSTALVLVHAGKGRITLQDYRSGTFFVQLHDGYVHLQNMGGDGFVQVLRGPIVAQDSSFTRLRVRNIAGPGIAFERCSARQIQVSTTLGQILYDNGSFDPGFARFESQYGRVAIGVGNGNAQIGAHSETGRIFTNFGRHANFGGTANDATASVGNNGPMVNVSAGGGVFLYDGSIKTRSNKGGTWQQFGDALGRRAERRPQASPTRAPGFPAPRRGRGRPPGVRG
ncbi:MAG: hypothetical protein GIW97_03630 [Candidatus Eremiobacteraeota bacterium]|nr:hypothetical protein [Candidatus Eremiobacteraeota bacterium]